MYRIKFTLKQHTPLIHFQHDQDGATLRASEVKPKLDKFLIKIFQHENKEIPNSWIIGNGDTLALKYKMSFQSILSKKYLVTASIPRKPNDQRRVRNDTLYKEDLYRDNIDFIDGVGYFADAEKISKKNFDGIKYGMTYEKISGVIILMDNDLKKEIIKYLEIFFNLHCFGCRTSKGFGSFGITMIDEKQISFSHEQFLDNLKLDNCIEAVYSCSFEMESDFVSILQCIRNDSQILRSGLNKPNQNPDHKKYVKSLLFLYFCQKYGKRWDKRWIKQQMGNDYDYVQKEHHPIDCNCNNNSDELSETDFLFERAVLGVPDTNEYKINSTEKFIVEVHNPTIERLKSPVVFKVINQNVYLIVYDYYKQVLGKSFQFKLFRKNREAKTFLRDFDDLTTPPTSFSMVEFLDWSFKYISDIENDIIIRDDNCIDDLMEFSFIYDKIYQKLND